MPISLIAVMLRLGKKYDMEHFLKEAVARLKHEFPRELSSWDSISDQSFSKIEQTGDIVMLDIIILAGEAGLQSILPLAYYLFFLTMRTQWCTIFSDGQATYILTHS